MQELVKIQTELKANKDLFNSFGGYGYRSAESILEAVKPLLKETNCTIVVSDDITMVGDRIYVKAIATIKNEKGETESAVSFAREAATKKGMDDSQITGAASSYARKYALCGLLAIDDRRDSDATNNGNPINENKLKSEFAAIQKKMDGCKFKEDLIALNEKHEDLWNYQPYVQYRDMKWNVLPNKPQQ
jgi:outer membrane cobalamin receptor